MQGAHEIQSYCLGHTDFVTSAAFAHTPRSTLLLSGGGDGTVRRALSQQPARILRITST